MTIRIEITGDNASQVASQLLTFTATMSQLLAPRAPATEAVHQGPAPDTVVETVAEQPAAPARRGRPRKGETIEHEPKEVSNANEPADAAASANAAGANGSGTGSVAEDAADGAGTGAAAAEAPEPAAQEQAAAEPAGGAKAEAVNVDDLRKHIVNNYLNTFFPTLEARKAKFDEILGVYGATKLNEIPADRLGEVKALVDGKIAALVGAK